MVMYEDNARLINRTLAALAPGESLRIIALGRLDAMLALREWLDGGGVAGVLADRTLATASERERLVRLPFLGAPATFTEAPLRLAALLRRPVLFMAGIYLGGNRYRLHFSELADFSAPPTPGPQDAAIRAALQRYVATLEALCREAPDNWFNFFDFWAEPRGSTTHALRS
jgi:hypothetical protein